MFLAHLRQPADSISLGIQKFHLCDHLDVQQEMSRDLWNDIKDKKNPDVSLDSACPINQFSAKKYASGLPCKRSKAQPASTFVLHPTSEQKKAWGKEPLGHQKPSLRSILSPLSAHRLKPIRQKTKNAVVCVTYFP